MCPCRRGFHKIRRIHPNVPAYAHNSDGACTSSGLGFLVFKRWKHGGVSFDPFFEANGNSKGGSTCRWVHGLAGDSGNGNTRGVLPSHEGQNKVFHSIHSAQIVNISMMERKGGGAKAEEKRPKERRKCGRGMS